MRIIRISAAAFFLTASLASASGWAQSNGQNDGQNGVQGSGQNDGTKGATNDPSKLKPVDKKFVNEAFDHAQETLSIGELATRQGQSEQVKKIGAQIVGDETTALSKLRDVAQKNGLTLPANPAPGTMDAVPRLTKLNGKQFDNAFLSHVRTTSNTALQNFEHEAKSGNQDDLKTYAVDQIPVIKGQLDQIKTGVTEMQKSNQGKSNAGGSGKMPAK